MKVRIGRPLLDFMDGGGLFQEPDRLEVHGYGIAGKNLVYTVRAAKRRKDGSVYVDLSTAERDVVSDYAECMEIGARDNLDPSPWGREDFASLMGEIRSAQAWHRQLEKHASR